MTVYLLIDVPSGGFFFGIISGSTEFVHQLLKLLPDLSRSGGLFSLFFPGTSIM
jgi:hypothetical protein